LFVGSSYYIYLSHYFWLALFAKVIIFKIKVNILWSIFILFLIGELVMFITWILIDFLRKQVKKE
jgi:hypothetical protein